MAGEVFDAIKTNNNFTSIATINAELTGNWSGVFISTLCYACLKRAFLIKTLPCTLKVVVASLHEKSTENSSSNEDSADKSKEEEIQELVEDVQESV